MSISQVCFDMNDPVNPQELSLGFSTLYALLKPVPLPTSAPFFCQVTPMLDVADLPHRWPTTQLCLGCRFYEASATRS